MGFLILFGIFSTFILNYNETDEYMQLINSSLYQYSLIDLQRNISKLIVINKPQTCPEGYASCTQDPNDLMDYVLNHQEYNDCSKNDSHLTKRGSPNLFTHIQGDWFLFNESSPIYLNASKSISFKLHRLYFSDLNIVFDRKKYLPLMNDITTCNLGKSDIEDRIKGMRNFYYSYADKLYDFQCDINLQNKSHSNLSYSSFDEYSFIYNDSLNYLDIMTTTNVYMVETDIYSYCNNEYYTPREACGHEVDGISQTRKKYVPSYVLNRRTHLPMPSKQYKVVLNIAQSWGYFHLFVETLPKLAPFIYWIKNEFKKKIMA